MLRESEALKWIAKAQLVTKRFKVVSTDTYGNQDYSPVDELSIVAAEPSCSGEVMTTLSKEGLFKQCLRWSLIASPRQPSRP